MRNLWWKKSYGFLSQYVGFSLSVSFHHCSLLVFNSSVIDTIYFQLTAGLRRTGKKNRRHIKQQYVVTHTIPQTDIPSVINSWVTNTLSGKLLCLQNLSLLTFSQKQNMLKYWSINDLWSIFVSCKIVKRKANWIGHILRRNCLLKQVIEEKIKGEMEVTRRRGRRRKKLLDELKDRRGYSHLKEEALDCTMWRNRFRGGFGPVVRQNTEWMAVFRTLYTVVVYFYAISVWKYLVLMCLAYALYPTDIKSFILVVLSVNSKVK